MFAGYFVRRLSPKGIRKSYGLSRPYSCIGCAGYSVMAYQGRSMKIRLFLPYATELVI